MLSALSLMHESSGSFPFVIKKKDKVQEERVQARGANGGGSVGKGFILLQKGLKFSVLQILLM